ncbi:MAG: iron complex outermembrane receptor protein [Halieaceae bacterium]|jgi:iron complex outermembrane receptor protein
MQFNNNRLVLNVTLFHTEYEDFQAQATESMLLLDEDGNTTDIDGNGKPDERFSFILTNVGEVTSMGIEIDFIAQTTCGDSPANQDLSGGALPFSPDWKLTLAANFVIPLESKPFDILLKANYRTQDDILYSIDQDQYQRQDAYQVLDVAVMLRDKDDHYSASVFVKNALDEGYVSNISAKNENLISNGYAQFHPRAYERQLGLELRYNWF